MSIDRVADHRRRFCTLSAISEREKGKSRRGKSAVNGKRECEKREGAKGKEQNERGREARFA